MIGKCKASFVQERLAFLPLRAWCEAVPISMSICYASLLHCIFPQEEVSMKRSLTLILLAAASAALFLAACGNSKKTESSSTVTSVPQTESVVQEKPAGDLYIESIPGTYTGLFDIVCTPEYHDVWIGQIATFVGETDAPSLADQLKSILTSRPAGESETSTVNNGGPIETNGYFICGLDTLTIDGHTISGADENGNTIFSHTYDYIGTDDMGFFEYKSADNDSGPFTYFLFVPSKTMERSWHLELRYGENIEALRQPVSQEYGSWMVYVIDVGYDESTAENAIANIVADRFIVEGGNNTPGANAVTGGGTVVEQGGGTVVEQGGPAADAPAESEPAGSGEIVEDGNDLG